MDGDPIPYKQGGIGSRFQETISVTGSKAASAFFAWMIIGVIKQLHDAHSLASHRGILHSICAG